MSARIRSLVTLFTRVNHCHEGVRLDVVIDHAQWAKRSWDRGDYVESLCFPCYQFIVLLALEDGVPPPSKVLHRRSQA